MMIKSPSVLALCSLVALSLAGCGKEATGQVAAVVNGDEVTLQEINAELGTANIPEGANREAAQQAALQRIIDRRVVAMAAREDKLDETPEFILRKRQLEETLLAQMLAQKIQQSLKVPDQAAIDKYIAEHPAMFANRTVYSVDRIQFMTPGDPTRLKALESAKTMDAVAATLDRLKIDFARGASEMDSLQLGNDKLARIRSLPAGEPFVVAENGGISVAVITGSRQVPLTGAEARPIALRTMQAEALTSEVQKRLAAARKAGEITYQSGFEPKSTGAAGTTPAKPATK